MTRIVASEIFIQTALLVVTISFSFTPTSPALARPRRMPRNPTNPSHPSFGPEYGSLDDSAFVTKYRASCYCGAICYETMADPVDAKICHCRTCQKLHGAPMQWAAIFYKRHVRLVSGGEQLRFYNSELDEWERILPCKVGCAKCGTWIADEGRNMWLAFPTLFDFSSSSQATAAMPDAFRPSCHIFYGARTIDMNDDGIPKWSGHKNKSTLLSS